MSGTQQMEIELTPQIPVTAEASLWQREPSRSRLRRFVPHFLEPATEDNNEDGTENDDEGEDNKDLAADLASVVRSSFYAKSVEFTGPCSHIRSVVHTMLHSQCSQWIVSCIIVINAAMIGMEQNYRKHGMSPSYLQTVEVCCLAAYTFELCLHLFTDPRKICSDHWLMFDAAVVVLGIADLVLTLCASEATLFENVTVFRLLRLLRLVRTIRLLKKIQVLWMLVRGLMESVSTMMNTVILLMIVMYVFSCISMEVITASHLAVGPNADPEFQAIVDKYFCSLPVTMLTLMQFLCLDSIGSIYKPLVEREPSLILFFGGVLLVVPIVMLNLVTAVIISGAINGAKRDKKAMADHEHSMKKKLIKHLSRIFKRLDTDHSGMVGPEEFTKLSDNDLENLSKMTGLTDPLELFRMIDLDDSGELDIDEFCESLWHVVIDKVPVDTRRTEKRVERLYDHMRQTKRVEVILLESVGELVACQKAFLDSRHVANSLQEKVASVEKMLHEISREAQQESCHALQQRPSMREFRSEEARISGISLQGQSTNELQASGRSIGFSEWSQQILQELHQLRDQLSLPLKRKRAWPPEDVAFSGLPDCAQSVTSGASTCHVNGHGHVNGHFILEATAEAPEHFTPMPTEVFMVPDDSELQIPEEDVPRANTNSMCCKPDASAW
eukprot:TRINITY_DN19200_c0_g2_i1.p1 TRINITY_DN19200_c0_g2~~TRINITY_DN19200_c0_g2_i1.p1  ORF type:complete len:670 (-),score=97.70 TRINITY_DN19200_c0_g2_i1:145-2154(-)